MQSAQSLQLRLEYWNTPSPSKIDELFRSLLGIRDVVSRCTWQNMTPEKVVETLNEFIKIRGEAVHTATIRAGGPALVRRCKWRGALPPFGFGVAWRGWLGGAAPISAGRAP